MRIKDAVANIHKVHKEDKLNQLYTPWGAKIRREHIKTVWQEYPRPGLVRAHYTMLNGTWKYAIAPIGKEDCEAQGVSAPHPGRALTADGDILVPFSPECLLSGVGRQLQPNEYLWYEREVVFPKDDLVRKSKKQRCILHFEAVDQSAAVFVNGKKVMTHVGGYLPFACDVTRFVSEKPLLLQVRVRDVSDTSWHSRGKQTLNRGGMFYTAQSGIWQSVWYEWVPQNYVKSFTITPDMDNGTVTVNLRSDRAFSSVSCTVFEAKDYSAESFADKEMSVDSVSSADKEMSAGGSFSAVHEISVTQSVKTRTDSVNTLTELFVRLPQDSIRLWTPENPFLYRFMIKADDDIFCGYFALRSFTVEPDEKGILRFCLNHKPYFLHGLLDQGYWSDGLMTAPCDAAFVYDIELAKKTGFHMLRKHVKIEPQRWYYHCDRLGMIVWQDMVSGGTTYRMPLVCYLPTVFPHIAVHTKDSHYRLFSRASAKGRAAWERECLDTVDHLYNVPSLAVWVLFNEGWGQFDAARIAKLIKAKDKTRPIDHASGWFDQKGGDFKSIHNYFRRLRVKPDGRRAFAISEYGGYACHIREHSAAGRIFGYRKFSSPKKLAAAYKELVEGQIFPLTEKGLSAAVYTQLSDVEEEVNGLVTYDRRVVKIYH